MESVNQHVSEEQLVWHYYGEAESWDVQAHLSACQECGRRFEALKSELNLLGTMQVPEPARNYGDEVWQRLVRADKKLGRKRRWQWMAWRQWAAAGLSVVLIAIAFFAGRVTERATSVAQQESTLTLSAERVLAAALSEHIEQAERTILPVVNASGDDALDVSTEQQRARALLASNRLYRQAAEQGGQTAVATVLEDLERVLLEVAHGPGELNAQEAEQLRQQIDRQELLFRLRVVGGRLDNMQQQEGNRI